MEGGQLGLKLNKILWYSTGYNRYSLLGLGVKNGSSSEKFLTHNSESFG